MPSAPTTAAADTTPDTAPAAAAVPAAGARPGPHEPVNPVLPGFHPDPSVCRVGDRYYLVGSSFEYFPGLPVHVSDDLVHWTPVGSVVRDPDAFDAATTGDSKGLYAPTIRHHDGVFVVAGTLVGKGDGTDDRGFYTTATDAAGPWSEPVWIQDAVGFDPGVFFDDGRVFWCAARIVRPGRYFGECEVWVREIDLARGVFVGDETVVWRGALHGATWCEGPRLFRRDGWYYLLTAEGGTFRDHAIVVARSREVTGPYENCPRNPILTHRHLGADFPVQNVGHADLVERPDGTWAAVLLAVRTVGRRHVLGRETFVADVVWEDGWPVVNPGHGVLLDVGDRPLDTVSDPARVEDALTVRGPATFATEQDDGVRLVSTGRGVAEPGRPAALLYRLRHHDARLGLTVGAVDPDASVGLLLRQSTDHCVRVVLAAGRVRVLSRAAGVDTEVDAWDLDAASAHRVEAAITPSGVRFTVDGRRSAAAPVDVLCSEVAGGFVGTVWGPFVEGPEGSAATITSRRYRSA